MIGFSRSLELRWLLDGVEVSINPRARVGWQRSPKPGLDWGYTLLYTDG